MVGIFELQNGVRDEYQSSSEINFDNTASDFIVIIIIGGIMYAMASSPASPLFDQPFVQVQIKGNNKVPRH